MLIEFSWRSMSQLRNVLSLLGRLVSVPEKVSTILTSSALPSGSLVSSPGSVNVEVSLRSFLGHFAEVLDKLSNVLQEEPLQVLAGSLAFQSGSINRENSLGCFLRPFLEEEDQAIQCSWGESPSVASSPAEHIHGCLHKRLGSLLWPSVSSGSMAGYRNYLAYQRVRVSGHSEGSPLLPSSDQRQDSDVPLGQQLSHCVTTESGRHSLNAQVLPNMEHPPVLPAAWDHAVSASHSRWSKFSCWQSVEKGSDHKHRVISAP